MDPFLQELQIEELNGFDFYDEETKFEVEDYYDDASFSDFLNSGNDFWCLILSTFLETLLLYLVLLEFLAHLWFLSVSGGLIGNHHTAGDTLRTGTRGTLFPHQIP